MDGDSQASKRILYKSPRHVQVLFLSRSRQTWKDNYMELKQNEKRLENRVRDVTKSREKWAAGARELAMRVKTLEAENAALKQELDALKKEDDFV
jgi:peptidoglycan hydrolase CwlO-like protein